MFKIFHELTLLLTSNNKERQGKENSTLNSHWFRIHVL